MKKQLAVVAASGAFGLAGLVGFAGVASPATPALRTSHGEPSWMYRHLVGAFDRTDRQL